MKSIITLFVALIVAGNGLAQNQYINYKAVVKDGSGNIVANQSVGVQFTVLENAVASFVEDHAAMTDANGIVILDIGQGNATTGTFNAINWSATTTLKTEIDIDGGLDNLVDMGTTEFKSVPYALNAGTSAFSTTANVTSNAPGDVDVDDFVFGSTQLAHSEALNIDDSRIFFDQSKGAFRAGTTVDLGGSAPSDGTAWNDASLGFQSFAAGFNTVASSTWTTAFGNQSIASGGISIAMGDRTIASGENSVAMGIVTAASGDNSTAMGNQTTASGLNSTAMGEGTMADAYGATAIGLFNVGGFVNATATDPLNPLFEIGNGTSTVASNALTVLYNGNTGINIATPAVALDVVGEIQYTGTITDVSDRRLKENIASIKNALEDLKKIDGYTYNMKNDANKKIEYGVIAQDLEKVFPEMVRIVDTENGYLGVSYIQLVPVLINGIKEQQELIEAQNDRILLLEAQYKDINKDLKDMVERLSNLEALTNN